MSPQSANLTLQGQPIVGSRGVRPAGVALPLPLYPVWVPLTQVHTGTGRAGVEGILRAMPVLNGRDITEKGILSIGNQTVDFNVISVSCIRSGCRAESGSDVQELTFQEPGGNDNDSIARKFVRSRGVAIPCLRMPRSCRGLDSAWQERFTECKSNRPVSRGGK